MLKAKLPDALVITIQSVLPEFTGHGEELIKDYAFDSFDLLTLRSRLEKDLNFRYRDHDWIQIKKFSDFVSKASRVDSPRVEKSLGKTRSHRLNMPQMNVSGLSEYWYLKEIGDLHWEMIADSLETSSDNIFDQTGKRLYASFVRIKISITRSLREFSENEEVVLRSELQHYGSFFLSQNTMLSERSSIQAELVTSFVVRGENNAQLYKATPAREPKVGTTFLREMPGFIEEYQTFRRQIPDPTDHLFEMLYEIEPYSDINGVGLLYFAAYPRIFDVCERSYMKSTGYEKEWSVESATASRDLYYLSNVDLTDKLIFKLRKKTVDHNIITFTSELYRQSDGKLVCLSICAKELKQ